MESIEFRKRIDSLIDKAYQGKVSLLPFLDEGEATILENEIKKYPDIYLFSSGRIENSLRKRYIISPFSNTNLDFKIVVFKIIYNKKYYEVTNRNILGSLMGLGIKREVVGDIVIDDNKNAYFAVTLEIHRFVLEELKRIGNFQIDLEVFDGTIENVIKYEAKKCFINSLRLDSVVADAINRPRSEAQELIYNGLVTLNYNICQNNSEQLKKGDIFSVRHYGKFLLSDILGESKSGKIIIEIKKRI